MFTRCTHRNLTGIVVNRGNAERRNRSLTSICLANGQITGTGQKVDIDIALPVSLDRKGFTEIQFFNLSRRTAGLDVINTISGSSGHIQHRNGRSSISKLKSTAIQIQRGKRGDIDIEFRLVIGTHLPNGQSGTAFHGKFSFEQGRLVVAQSRIGSQLHSTGGAGGCPQNAVTIRSHVQCTAVDVILAAFRQGLRIHRGIHPVIGIIRCSSGQDAVCIGAGRTDYGSNGIIIERTGVINELVGKITGAVTVVRGIAGGVHIGNGTAAFFRSEAGQIHRQRTGNRQRTLVGKGSRQLQVLHGSHGIRLNGEGTARTNLHGSEAIRAGGLDVEHTAVGNDGTGAGNRADQIKRTLTFLHQLTVTAQSGINSDGVPHRVKYRTANSTNQLNISTRGTGIKTHGPVCRGTESTVTQFNIDSITAHLADTLTADIDAAVTGICPTQQEAASDLVALSKERNTFHGSRTTGDFICTGTGPAGEYHSVFSSHGTALLKKRGSVSPVRNKDRAACIDSVLTSGDNQISTIADIDITHTLLRHTQLPRCVGTGNIQRTALAHTKMCRCTAAQVNRTAAYIQPVSHCAALYVRCAAGGTNITKGAGQNICCAAVYLQSGNIFGIHVRCAAIGSKLGNRYITIQRKRAAGLLGYGAGTAQRRIDNSGLTAVNKEFGSTLCNNIVVNLSTGTVEHQITVRLQDNGRICMEHGIIQLQTGRSMTIGLLHADIARKVGQIEVDAVVTAQLENHIARTAQLSSIHRSILSGGDAAEGHGSTVLYLHVFHSGKLSLREHLSGAVGKSPGGSIRHGHIPAHGNSDTVLQAALNIQIRDRNTVTLTCAESQRVTGGNSHFTGVDDTLKLNRGGVVEDNIHIITERAAGAAGRPAGGGEIPHTARTAVPGQIGHQHAVLEDAVGQSHLIHRGIEGSTVDNEVFCRQSIPTVQGCAACQVKNLVGGICLQITEIDGRRISKGQSSPGRHTNRVTVRCRKVHVGKIHHSAQSQRTAVHGKRAGLHRTAHCPVTGGHDQSTGEVRRNGIGGCIAGIGTESHRLITHHSHAVCRRDIGSSSSVNGVIVIHLDGRHTDISTHIGRLGNGFRSIKIKHLVRGGSRHHSEGVFPGRHVTCPDQGIASAHGIRIIHLVGGRILVAVHVGIVGTGLIGCTGGHAKNGCLGTAIPADNTVGRHRVEHACLQGQPVKGSTAIRGERTRCINVGITKSAVSQRHGIGTITIIRHRQSIRSVISRAGATPVSRHHATVAAHIFQNEAVLIITNVEITAVSNGIKGSTLRLRHRHGSNGYGKRPAGHSTGGKGGRERSHDCETGENSCAKARREM